MTHSKISLALATGLAMALAACGDNDAEEVPVVAETTAVVADFDPMTRDYALSEDAQTRRDEFDSDAFQSEYAGYRDEIVSEQVRMGDDSGGDSGTGMSEEDRTEMEAASQARDTSTNMRARENMTWSYLDRNDDGQLSVAEYAIWAIPLDPTKPKANDQAPYLTAEQANKAADSFFYYDQDGDTYLSQREFTSARRGDMVG